MKQEAMTICRNCNNVFTGKFCNDCGEKLYSEEDKKVSHFLHELFHFATHLDHKILRTLWLVFSKPALVSYEYCAGRKKNYFKPITFFLVMVFLYLLFPLMSGLNMQFDGYLNASYLSEWAQAKSDNLNISLQLLSDKYNQTSPKVAKLMLVVLLPLTAAVLKLLFFKRRKFYYDHLILAAEFNTVLILLTFFILPLSFMLINHFLDAGILIGDGGIAFLLVQTILITSILVLSFRRFYQVSWLHAIGKTILFLPLFAAVILLYRLLLFSMVMMLI